MPLSDHSYFVQQLLRWNRLANNRSMPWKGEKDAYKIWLSEIILQQTRVEQGLEYYKKFINEFPTVVDLANASDTRVMKLWEGLGYYSRCRNLLKTARLVRDIHDAQFPTGFQELIKLPGVGPYTAAAISSFAANAPHAVVDGNVIRVLARFFGIHRPVADAAGKKVFEQLAQDILPHGRSAVYNQAIMDFGATVCKPAAPLCATCMLRNRCYAFNQQEISSLPVKLKRPEKKDRYFHFIYIRYNGKVCLVQRHKKDIWQGLYQFPAIETHAATPPEHFRPLLNRQPAIWVDVDFTQMLTHQKIHARFYRISMSKKPDIPDGLWIDENELNEYPMPKVMVNFLKNIHN